MGNASKKLAAKCTLLSKEEQKVIGESFHRASRNSDKIREDELIKIWGPQMDPRLAQYINNFLFGFGYHKCSTTDFQRFAELYVYSARGTTEERLQLTFNCLGKEYSDSSTNAELEYQLLKEYCESIASTYIKILKNGGSKKARAWMDKGFRGRPQHVQALGETLAAGLASNDDVPATRVSGNLLRSGLANDMLLKLLSELVIRHLYGVSKRSSAEDGSPNSNLVPVLPHLLPSPIGLELMPDYPAFIDLSHIVWLNSHMPTEYQHRWRFLFSSHIHGESFSTMMGRIIEMGPSILIIEDNSGHIFGGYAPTSWQAGPNFVGTDKSFLFSLAPRMRHYPSSGYNDHYQYLNTHQKTMPNGLMMGGQFDYGGIWLDYEFGHGSTAESCSTYKGYKQLSKDKNFTIRCLEVWGVGDKPLSLKESGERTVSVLDSNYEAKAILEMAGRKEHSAGLREPPQL